MKTSGKNSAPDSKEGRFRLMIGERVETIALGDTGADCSALPRTMFEKHFANDKSIPVKVFDKPKIIDGPFADEEKTNTASCSAILSIIIYLPGSNIPVRIRKVEFIISDQPMDEIIQGRPFLDALNFNFENHLEKVYKEVHGKNMDELISAQSKTAKIAKAKYRGVSYLDSEDDPITLPETVSTGIGKGSPEYINAAFGKFIESAKSNNMSDKGVDTLEDVLKKHRNVFRIKLGPDPPANVEPLVITRVENARSFRSPQRRWSGKQRAFLERTIRELEAVGVVYPNPRRKWACSALAVPKPGTDKLRFTVDLRGANARTVPLQSAMPHLESRLLDVEGNKYFAVLDLAPGKCHWLKSLKK